MVLSQHAEEAAFLWLLRDAAVMAPHYSLKHLSDLDGRVEAHVDGLRIAGEAGWGRCKEELTWRQAGEVFAAAVIALENGGRRKLNDVVEAAISSPATTRGLVSAFGWLPFERVTKPIAQLLSADAPELRRIGIAATAARRLPAVRELEDALEASDARLRARALRAAGELGLGLLLPPVAAGAGDSDARCRFSAAWSAALLGMSEVARTLQQIALCPGPDQQPAAAMALRCMKLSEATAWWQELVRRPSLRRLAVIGAGVLGDPVAVPWLIEQTSNSDVARVAGEAFCMITGADLTLMHLEGQRPDGFLTGPTEQPEDDDVSMDADDNLPWPDPERVANWWHLHGANFVCGRRYLVGKPIVRESLEAVLRDGFQRQRAAAALELALLEPNQPLFEVRAPARRQEKLLGVHRYGAE